MAARATWKGFLKISLVNIPVKVFPATESKGSLSFNQLHAECRTRIQQKKWCPHCEREVSNEEIVKGYEFEKGHYVVLSDEDFDNVRPKSTRVIDLVQFAEASAIDPMFVDRTYYLAPDGPVASEAFAVMRDGMAGKVGVGKLALYGREYLVAVKPQGRGIVMHTLHHAAEIRGMDQVEELASVPATVRPEEMRLAQQVIATFEAPLDLSTYTDEYQAGLQRIIDAKIAGEEIVAPAAEAPPKVVNLMDALRKSLETVSAAQKKPAKAGAAKAARVTPAKVAAPLPVRAAKRKRA
jgi:DNA end-binding protein Ku